MQKRCRFFDVVHVFPPPTAIGAVDPSLVNIDTPLVLLQDMTSNILGRTWIIDGKEYFYDKDLQYAFGDTGWHTVRLIASDRFLCTDTLDFRLFVYRDFSLFMPNAFSPNGDGDNEDFKPVGQFTDLVSYEMKIYDRWGGKIFETKSVGTGWNGKYNNTADDLPVGVYIYEINYQAANKEPVTEKNN